MSARIASEVSLWVCHLFRFTDGAAFCHDDTREGLVKITRMALHQHYPKMSQDGFEALFSRPPVIYLTSNTYVDIAHYVCMQLGLPLSTVSLTFVFENILWTLLYTEFFDEKSWFAVYFTEQKSIVQILVNLFLPCLCTDLTWMKDVHTRLKCNLVNFEIPNGFLYYGNNFGIWKLTKLHFKWVCVHPSFKWDLCSERVKMG